MKRLLLMILVAVGTARCATGGLGLEDAYGNAAAASTTRGQSPMPPSSAPRLIFGGVDHRIFLGCLNCNQYDSKSVDNKFGEYGSPYSATSIFNPYSEYGSRYSATSACNEYASDPPIVVDESGLFIGSLSLNRYARTPLRDGYRRAWLAAICAGK